MKAIRIHEYNETGAIRLDHVARPAMQDDEVLVRVHAASVNPVDWKVCDGLLSEKLVMQLPFIPGGDFSGVIEDAGAKVTDLAPGTEVFGMTSTAGYRAGAFADYVCVKAGDVAKKPTTLSMIEAASVPLAALTAWQAVFDRATLQAGQQILIHAGAGGVGSFAIQFARVAGARITTTTSPANTDYVRDLGADTVIDYRAVKFETVLRDLDIVIDLIGNDTQARSYSVLRRGGVLVNAWGAIMQDHADAAGVRGVKVAVQADGGQLAEIAGLIDVGTVRTTIARVFPLADTADALALSRSGHVRGKIVLAINA